VGSDDRSPKTPPTPPAAALSQLLRGSLVTQLIHVAATLGVADFMRDGPKSSHELAASLGVDQGALYRVLRALASMGVFEETDPGCFALTTQAQPLRTDVPGSLRASAMLYGEPWWWQACGDLLHSVRTGQPAFAHVHGESLFAYLDHTADAAAIFNDHQTNMTRQDAAAVVSAYGFRESTRVVDVGAGHGALTAAILKACPWTTAVLFDQPAVIEGAKQRLRAEGVTDRCTCIGGDFFESVPQGGDAYVLKDIVHDWDDDRAIAILRNCRRVMAQTSAGTPRVLVVEKVIPPGNAPFPGKLTDITMLLITGGRERTAKEYETLLAGAGLALTRIVPTASPASVIEAVLD
jgi:ubiquinone/menaquinone biosynthesis C-methylase UbiE